MLDLDLDYILDEVQEVVNNFTENRFEFLKREKSLLVPEGINYLVEVNADKTSKGEDSLYYTFLSLKPQSEDKFFVKNLVISLPKKPVLSEAEKKLKDALKEKGEDYKTPDEKKYAAQALNLVKWTNDFLNLDKKANIKESLQIIKDVLLKKAFEVDIVHVPSGSFTNTSYQSVKAVEFKYLDEYRRFSAEMKKRNQNKNDNASFTKNNAPAPQEKVYNEEDIPF